MATFILIHGSFHAAWNWHKVVPLMEESGSRAIAMDMPGHGLDTTPLHSVTLQNCVDKVIQQIDVLNEKVILVAHNRNGMVISQVAEARSNKIERLIYLAAYLVPNGKSMMDFGKLDTDSLVYQNVYPKVSRKRIDKVSQLYKNSFVRFLLKLITPKKQKTHKLDIQIFKKALYHDCPDEITELANVLLSPEPNFPGFEILTLTNENYGSVAKTYIECLQDRVVTLNLQRLMQQESPCDDVYQLDSGHSPFFSIPDKLVEIFLKFE